MSAWSLVILLDSSPVFSMCCVSHRVVDFPRRRRHILSFSMSTSLVAPPVFREEGDSEDNPDRRLNMRTRSARRVWVEHPRPLPSVSGRASSSGPVPSCIAKGQPLSRSHFPHASSKQRASSQPPVRVRIVLAGADELPTGALEWQWMLQQ